MKNAKQKERPAASRSGKPTNEENTITLLRESSIKDSRDFSQRIQPTLERKGWQSIAAGCRERAETRWSMWLDPELVIWVSTKGQVAIKSIGESVAFYRKWFRDSTDADFNGGYDRWLLLVESELA